MKIKLFSFVVALALFSSLAFAQSVVITPKKLTYKRQKPLSEYKKSFTIIYPKISGVGTSLAEKIEANLSYEKHFDFSLKNEIKIDTYLDEAFYKMLYNKRGILNLLLTQEVSGAYPSTLEKSVVINLKTGEQIKISTVFIKLYELAAKVGKAQKTEIEKAPANMKKISETEDISFAVDQLKKSGFKIKNLDNFIISDKGITFRYDYGFPHVIKALQPEGRYFFSWAELKPFIKRGGLLEKFKR